MSLQAGFRKTLDKAQKSFDKGKKGRQGLIHVDDGKYIVRLHSAQGLMVDGRQEKGKVPCIRFNTVVVHSEDESDIGARVDAMYTIETLSGEKDGKKWEISKDQVIADVTDALRSFGFDLGDSEDIGEIADAIEEIESENPESACRITVKTNKGGYKNVRFGKPVDDEDLPELEDIVDDDDEDIDDDDVDESDVEDEEEEEEIEEDDSDSDEEEEDDDEEEEEDEDDEEEEEEDFTPAKGAKVKAKPKGTTKTATYTVKTSNKTKETCTLVRVRDKKEFKNQSWDVVSGPA
jgi:cobalamin biosynthesis protein CobT